MLHGLAYLVMKQGYLNDFNQKKKVTTKHQMAAGTKQHLLISTFQNFVPLDTFATIALSKVTWQVNWTKTAQEVGDVATEMSLVMKGILNAVLIPT